jgi:hypothetical protein
LCVLKKLHPNAGGQCEGVEVSKGYIDYCQNDAPVCPYCDVKYDIEDGGFEEGSWEEVGCQSCEKKFLIERVVITKWSSRGSCERNGELPHSLLRGAFDSSPYSCQKCCREYYDWELPQGRYPKLQEGTFEILQGRGDFI